MSLNSCLVTKQNLMCCSNDLTDDKNDDNADQHDGDVLLVSGRHVSDARHRLPLSRSSDNNAHKQNVEDRQDYERQEREESLVHVAVADTVASRVAELRVHLHPLAVLLYSRTLNTLNTFNRTI